MPPAVAKESNDIHWFSSVDMSKDGKTINAEYPSWYHDAQQRDLEDDILRLTHEVKNTTFGNQQHLRETLARKKAQLDAVLEAKPKMSDAEFDRVAKITDEMGAKLAEAMPSWSEMNRGRVTIEEEVRRMTTPCIKLTPEMAGFCARANVPVSKDRMVTRDGLSKAWKIQRKAMGEIPDVDLLRRD